MATLPTPGGDTGTWGTELNAWALVGHNTDGTHRAVFDVLEYGAEEGVTDDTNAINAAVTAAAAAGGGVVLLGGNHYLGSGPIVPASNVTIQGRGRGGTILTANAALTGGQADLIRLVKGVAESYEDYVTIRGVTLDCSAQTAGNGMTLQGINNLLLEDIRVIKSYGYGINWGSEGGAEPYILNPVGRNVWCQGCGRGVGNDSWGGGGIRHGLISGYWCLDADDATEPGGTAWDHTNLDGFTLNDAYAISDGAPAAAAFMTDFGSKHLTFRNLFVNGWQYGVLVTSDASGQVSDLVVDGLHVESVSRHGIFLNTTATYGVQRFKVINNDILQWDTAAAGNAGIKIQGGHDGIVANNSFGSTASAYAIRLLGDEESTTVNPPTYVRVEGNDVRLAASKIWPQFIDSTVAFRNNPGYNPLGHAVTQPSVPASNGTVTNSTGADCSVYLTAGTVTAIAIGGTATGLAYTGTGNASVRVPAGQSIKLTYSAGTPTWQWFGD